MGTTNDAGDAPVDAVVHTPGPWRVYTWAEHMPRAGQPSTIGQGDDLGMDADDVCKILPIDWEDEQAARATEWANARLIAAAPELLDACKILLMLSLPTDISGERMVERARAAVAKAEGRSVV